MFRSVVNYVKTGSNMGNLHRSLTYRGDEERQITPAPFCFTKYKYCFNPRDRYYQYLER